MPLSSVYQKTIANVDPTSKSYLVTISNRQLKWEFLRQYLELQYEGLRVPKQQKKTLNDKFVIKLPSKLSPGQLQDIDLLRGDDEDAREFLQDLKHEMHSRLLPVAE